MENNKLISMTDLVLSCDGNKETISSENEYFTRVVTNYAKFLKQPLTLSMFVPTDEDGNVLEEPENYLDILSQGSRVYHYDDIKQSKEYLEAKSKCLFDGFTAAIEIDGELCLESDLVDLYPKYWNGETIEFILELGLIENSPLTLTELAIKQIYG